MRYEPGIYIGAFQQAGVEIMGEKQTPFMCLTFQITHRVRGTELEPLYDEECATRDVRLCLNDNSIEYTEPKLAAMGFNGNYENPTFSEAIESDSVRLICMENGKYEDWSIAGLMNGQRERKPAPKDLLRTLNAKWKAHQGGFKGSPNTRPTTNEEAKRQHEETVAAGIPEDDTIPF